MKRIINLTLSLVLLFVVLHSCSSNDDLRPADGATGVMMLQMKTNKPTNILSQIAKDVSDSGHQFAEEDVDVEKYTVNIYNRVSGELVKTANYKDLLDQGGEVKLEVGNYTVEAFNYDGSSVKASNRPYFYGKFDFQIKEDTKTNVTVVCRLTNVGIVLNLTDKFNTIFKDDYTIEVDNGADASCTYNKDNINKPFYLQVPENSSVINVLVKGTTKDGNKVEHLSVINHPEDAEGGNKLKANEIFIITIDPDENPSVEFESKVSWKISVNLMMNEKNKLIEIPTENISNGEDPDPKPEPDNTIEIIGLDKTYNISLSSSEVPTVEVKFIVPKGIENLFVKIESDNAEFVDILKALELAEEFDLANPGELPLGTNGGIGLIDENDPIKGKTEYDFKLTDFMAMLKITGKGGNQFKIRVVDGDSKTASGKLTVNVVD